ncbi:MAG: aspartate aminotransferase family protein [Deltaproteobacteria bacterium]|nr:aspartate aminotransferase family protein [Deltaproteobacteria bacterium]
MKVNPVEEYRRRTPRSERWFREAQGVFPGGVCHNYRYYPPYPAVMERVDGGRMWDLDGNEYIDLWMGHYALILGHNPPLLRQRLSRITEMGLHWGVPSPSQLEFGRLIQRTVPCAERVRFGVTGTEATMYAVRLARAFTGRNVILKTAGGWHGANTELTFSIKPPLDAPQSGGIPPEFHRYTDVLPFNDEEATRAIIDRYAHDLAAVILEPAAGSTGFWPARPDYLRFLREETRRVGALLIFDEIITGYRLDLSGAQGLWDVVPDLATLGKVAGGGAALGCVAGRTDVMDAGNMVGGDFKGRKALVGGGTFSCDIVSMELGHAVVSYLAENAGTIYPELERKGKRLREGMESAFRKAGIPARATGVGSLFGMIIPHEEDASIRSPRDVLEKCDVPRIEQEFKLHMMNRGVYTQHGGGAVSMAHTDRDIDAIISATEDAASAMAAK